MQTRNTLAKSIQYARLVCRFILRLRMLWSSNELDGELSCRRRSLRRRLRLSESTVQRTTEAAGERLGAQLHAGTTFGPAQTWPWNKDATGQTCAYVSLDLTGVPQQASGGGEAESRMPYVAMVYNAVPELPEDCPHQPPAKAEQQARYLAGLYDLEELGQQMRRQAAQVGMEQAEHWIGLSDGGNGLEEFVRVNFARDPILILDFYHPAERLCDLAKLAHPGYEDQAEKLGRRGATR